MNCCNLKPHFTLCCCSVGGIGMCIYVLFYNVKLNVVI